MNLFFIFFLGGRGGGGGRGCCENTSNFSFLASCNLSNCDAVRWISFFAADSESSKVAAATLYAFDMLVFNVSINLSSCALAVEAQLWWANPCKLTDEIPIPIVSRLVLSLFLGVTHEQLSGSSFFNDYWVSRVHIFLFWSNMRILKLSHIISKHWLYHENRKTDEQVVPRLCSL